MGHRKASHAWVDSLHRGNCALAPIAATFLVALPAWFGVISLGDAVASRPQRARISVLITTGMPGSTYYHVGSGMASLWTTKLRGMGIRASAAASEGSPENIEAIKINDADLIIVEEVLADAAFSGNGPYSGHPLRELRSIATLWPDTVHLVIGAAEVHTGTVEDLAGLTVATGLPESGNRYTTELLLQSLASKSQDVRVRSMSHTAAAEELRNGAIQAIALAGGIPEASVTNLFREAKPRLALLEISDAQMEVARRAGWTQIFRQVIPAGMYPGQTRAVRSVGQMNQLAVAASLDNQVVYWLTKTLFDNLDYLVRLHPACRSITLERAFAGLTVPLHPGAARYYKEKRLEIPSRLLPP